MTFKIITHETDTIPPELIAMGFRSELRTDWFVVSDEIVGRVHGPFNSEAQAAAWAKDFFEAKLDHFGM